MARGNKVSANALRDNLKRANTSLLLSSVMLFQFTAMLLLTFKTSPFDHQALIFAVALPTATYLVSMGFSKIWPVDRTLLILTLFLCSISLVTLQDIARAAVTPRNQAIHMSAGLVAMVMGIVFIRRVRNWDNWAVPLAVASFALVVLPLVFGREINGAKNWLGFPDDHVLSWLSIQPSEFVKLALIVILAASLSSKPRFKQCLPWLLFSGLLCGVLLMQKDLGALLLYFLTTVAMYFAATSNIVVTLGGLGMGVAGAFLAYKFVPLVQTRVALFQNPWSDPQKGGYQLVQALIAIGSGGAFGMGLGLGYPRSVPLYHSDFIFSSICEEFGLIFGIGVLCVYAVVVLRGMTAAMNARTSFHALVAFGVVTLIGLQTFVIVGGNTKMLPLTGVTLPFVSAGGSSIITMMGGMGMLLGVSSLNANDEVSDLERLQWREGARA